MKTNQEQSVSACIHSKRWQVLSQEPFCEFVALDIVVLDLEISLDFRDLFCRVVDYT
jgi:hypothetical protein